MDASSMKLWNSRRAYAAPLANLGVLFVNQARREVKRIPDDYGLMGVVVEERGSGKNWGAELLSEAGAGGFGDCFSGLLVGSLAGC